MDLHLGLFEILAKSQELIGQYRDQEIDFNTLEEGMNKIGYTVVECTDMSIEIKPITHNA